MCSLLTFWFKNPFKCRNRTLVLYPRSQMNKTDQAWIIVQRWWIFKKNANRTNGKNKCLVLRFSAMDRLIIEVTKVMTRIFLEWPRADRDVLSPMCTSACICLHTLVSYLIRQCLKGMNKLNVSIEQWRNGRSCCILFWHYGLSWREKS